ncbi:hypothetical protein SDC9_125776 [bioreactor metagenome]|uniref:Uncharacterized protein n=1 Tax=bioreactor metagenome TaxID=1076179 RepID=A0A645CPE3_9ZZZZ
MIGRDHRPSHLRGTCGCEDHIACVNDLLRAAWSVACSDGCRFTNPARHAVHGTQIDVLELVVTHIGPFDVGASCRDFADRLEFDALWRQFRDQLVDAAHAVPSRSATISSIEARSSAWRATMRAISSFNSVMSMTSRLSSCAT